MEQINLSRRLVGEVVEVLRQREPACDDALIASQYLAAIIACLVASHDASSAHKDEVVEELGHFMRHVYADLSRAQPQPQPQPQPQSAFGIWKPPK